MAFGVDNGLDLCNCYPFGKVFRSVLSPKRKRPAV